MDSAEKLTQRRTRAERSARWSYEWARLRLALMGTLPLLVVVTLGVLLAARAASAFWFGSAVITGGAVLLWYGRDLGRGVLPGLGAGAVPLSLALLANHIGHACMGDRCVSLCLPACVLGGVTAGGAIAFMARRRGRGLGFWLGASGVALATGAMGCACMGSSGVLGLAAGYAAASAPVLVHRLRGA